MFILGVVATVAHLDVRRDPQRGSWLVFWVVSAVTTLLVVAVAYAIGNEFLEPHGAPTGADNRNGILLLAFGFSGPGIGLIAGWSVAKGYRRT